MIPLETELIPYSNGINSVLQRNQFRTPTESIPYSKTAIPLPLQHHPFVPPRLRGQGNAIPLKEQRWSGGFSRPAVGVSPSGDVAGVVQEVSIERKKGP